MEIDEILDKAEHALRTADHMVYITYPLIKENRLLKKVIEQLYEISDMIINAVLQYEYTYKRIHLYKDKKQNFETFKNKCAKNFGIMQEEIEGLAELLELMEKHIKSSSEFSRKDKLVIMSNGLKTESIGLDKLKNYLNLLKKIIQKVKTKLKDKIY